jgi:hypothetical protein
MATEKKNRFFSHFAPPEIIVSILQSCDSTDDVLALARSCRYIRNVWVSNTATILRHVLFPADFFLEEALIAVRLTKRVLNADRHGEQLPPVAANPGDFSSSRRSPSLAELKAASDLNHFVETAVRIALQTQLGRSFQRESGAEGGRETKQTTPEPQRIPAASEFKNRMRRAFYRTLIAGGALAGVYHEPRFVASRHPDPEIAGMTINDYFKLSRHRLAFFDQFAISNMEEMPEEEEAAFGPFGKWLLENILSDRESRAAMADRFETGSGRSRYCRRRGDCPVGFVDSEGSHADAHLVVWELMQMLWADEHLERIINSPSWLPFNPPDVTPFRDARAVFFGRFEVETVRVPASLSTEADPSSLEIPHIEVRRRPNPASPTFTMHFLGAVYTGSERPNRHRTSAWPGRRDALPPLAIKLFVWFFNRYLGLSFAPDTFVSMHGANQDYRGLLDNYAIFAHDDVEDHSPHDPELLWLRGADFLDGSELRIKTDPNAERYYHVEPRIATEGLRALFPLSLSVLTPPPPPALAPGDIPQSAEPQRFGHGAPTAFYFTH